MTEAGPSKSRHGRAGLYRSCPAARDKLTIAFHRGRGIGGACSSTLAGHRRSRTRRRALVLCVDEKTQMSGRLTSVGTLVALAWNLRRVDVATRSRR
jgi:hypothetical protein